MKSVFSFLCVGFFAVQAMAEPLSDEACEQLIIQSGDKEDILLYDDCGFGDENRAWNHWAPFASAHGLKRAMFELCRRYPYHAYGPMYCDKVVELQFGPALAYKGYERLRADNTKEALEYFNQAVKSNELTDTEVQKITETLGTLYLDKSSDHYAPDTGIALLTKAANNRSAVANNALAYLSYSGEHRIKKDDKKALSFLWKSILLKCPAAEENLGAYHLARQRKISEDDAAFYMSLQAFTCEPFDKNPTSNIPKGCDCQDVLKQDRFFKSAIYLHLGMQGDRAILLNPNGEKFILGKGEVLPDGFVIQEITPYLVVLLKGDKRVSIHRYHNGVCVGPCLKNAINPKRQPVRIRPYHLTFTEEECANIDYYAKKLVDTTLPYVGKEECHGAEMDETAQLLLQK